MTVVHDHFGSHLHGGEIIDAACAICDVGEQQRQQRQALVFATRLRVVFWVGMRLEDVGNDRPINHETLGHLQCHSLNPVSPQLVNGLVNLKRVVGRQR